MTGQWPGRWRVWGMGSGFRNGTSTDGEPWTPPSLPSSPGVSYVLLDLRMRLGQAWPPCSMPSG